MKILQVHKYYSKNRGGGSVTAFFELIKILSKKGNEVVVFSMKDKDNEKSPHEKYFAQHFDLNEKMGIAKKIKLIPKIIYNTEAKEKIVKLIEKEKPAVAHLHNIYHYLSPSIIDALKERHIPIVMTLHAYKEICPNYKLFTKGKVCERCKGGKYYNCFLNKCVKDSYSKSFLAAFEAYFHKIRKTYGKVDVFISPSDFLKKKYVEFGIPENKIKVLRNIFNIDDFCSTRKDFLENDYFLYYGRLSQEKGIGSLILAVKELKDKRQLGKNKLVIIGKGPEEKKLKSLAKELEIENEIEFLGFKKGEELKDLILGSKFAVLPSIWYDNSPLVILETQLLEKPIIVSDLGGSKETILGEKSGLVFEAGNITNLAEKIAYMLKISPEERKKMGQIGAQNIREMFNEDKLYQELIKIYTDLSESNLPK